MDSGDKPILVGYDGSETSKRALRWALEEAALRAVPVTILHAEFPDLVRNGMGMAYYDAADDPVLDRGSELLDEALDLARAWRPDISVSGHLSTQGAAVALLNAMDEASLLVVGSRGHNPFLALLIGSTSLHVATHADVPVVIVHAEENAVPGPEAGRVVVGVDGSAASDDALGRAFTEAQLRGIGLTAVRSWYSDYVDVASPRMGGSSVPTDTTAIVEDESADLAQSVEAWAAKYPDVDVRQHVVRGRPAQVLLDEGRGAELLVVGSRGRGGFRTLLLGSVGHALIRHATGPVMVVRPHAAG